MLVLDCETLPETDNAEFTKPSVLASVCVSAPITETCESETTKEPVPARDKRAVLLFVL